MDQATFAELEHDGKKRTTRREKFLAKMDGLIPWERLERRVEPSLPEAGAGVGGPYPLGTMLRVHCVQLFYNLSDPGIGGFAVRGGVGSAFRGFAFDGSAAGRDDDIEVSPFAGEARSGRGVVRGNQRAPGVAGPSAEAGHDRGREHHRRAEFDEEQGVRAGPGDASDEEGQSVVFRHEGAHRGGFGVGFDAYAGDHAGERFGRGARVPDAAWG